nr:hypothetical protein CFP56_11275 [Quercus suber]
MIAAGPGFCHTEFGRSLFTSSIGMGWLKGLVTGEPSPFDDSRWLALRPESCFNALVLETQDGPWQRARVLTLLPRLVQLIRHVKQDRGDRTSLFAAAAVANKLLGFLWGAGAKTLPASWHTQPDAVDTIVLPFRLRLPEPSYRRAVAYSMHWA